MKNDIGNNLELYHEPTPWCEELLGVELAELEKPVELNHYEENRTQADLENAIALYKALKDLPYSVASDEKYWVFLTHIVYWDYMRKRWPVESAQGDAIVYVKARFFNNGKIARNGLARLWWYAAITYDENHETDPYFYTRLLLSKQDIANLIIDSSRVARNPRALQAFLICIERINKMEDQGLISKIKNKEKFIRDSVVLLNNIGGITIWDALDKKEAEEKLWGFMEKRLRTLQVTL